MDKLKKLIDEISPDNEMDKIDMIRYRDGELVFQDLDQRLKTIKECFKQMLVLAKPEKSADGFKKRRTSKKKRRTKSKKY